MKNLITTFFAVILAVIAHAQGIRFEDSLNWKQITDKAKMENKYIFMDAYASWCVPCKEMDANTFPKKEVGDFINERFVSVKVQMDQLKNDNDKVKSWYVDAKEISGKYEVSAFPTILIFNTSAELAGKILGFRDANELIAEAKKIIEDSEAFEPKYRAYLAGKNDSAYVKALVVEADRIGRKGLAHTLAQKYINNLSESELFKPHNLVFTYVHTSKSTDRGFKIFRNQAKKADDIFGPKFRRPSKRLVDKIIYGEEIEPYAKSGNADWEKILSTIKKKYEALDDEYYYGIRMYYASENKLWDEFGKFYALYYKTAFNHSAYHINNISWWVAQYVNDPSVLDVAVNTMKYNNEHYDMDNAGAWDTYANLLYKAGRKAEAIAAQEKAVELSKNGKEFVDTLEKMKAGAKIW
ncbi:thioredoxin fold domain-containing protein [Pedobacter sp. JY14-1]|uniref:thioredoxin family protein n=1 Tax=Pedobacter sp. JY14-1 TaxID=3034151 RepID=UPI0023E0E856|nr:thioredoxin fold domain-containing protein [Pedobacter sp. JY14-1]